MTGAAFQVRPVYNGMLMFLRFLPMQILFALWCGGFLGGLTSTMHLFAKNSSFPFVAWGIGSFVLVTLILHIGKRKSYARAEYSFYDDRVELRDGFFSVNRKVLRYKDIKEVTLRKGFLQARYGLGSISLATQATGTTPSYLLDLANPDEVYEKVRNKILQQGD